MKKNKMMRLASVLLIAVMVSTSAISGTYAKYVTEASGQDSARVAKWGVTVVVAGSELFKNTYTDTTNGVTVESLDEQKVVAPGTSSEESVPMTFKVFGQPEVDVNLKFEMTDVKDVFLAPGTYTDYTKVTGYDSSNNPIYGNSFTVGAEGYYPVVFTLKNNIGTVLESGKLADIKDYLESAAVSKNYDAKTNLATVLGGNDGVYTLTWEWEFESGHDEADTFLGNLMVDPSLTDAANYNLTVGYNLKITATQVD